MFETFGEAALGRAASADALWLLFSNTKVLTASSIWALVEDGKLSFFDRVADHLPEFAQHGKSEITIAQLVSHRAGFPNANCTSAAWTDAAEMRRQVCNFTLEWTPGTRLQYHPRSAFYQMLVNGGRLNGARIFSKHLIEFVTRNHTGDMHDYGMDMPMHRGLGVHVRGDTVRIRGLGGIGSPRTFGHGGVGSSYCWADPDSGVSFAYITNSRVPDPWHSVRLDRVANIVHSAIE